MNARITRAISLVAMVLLVGCLGTGCPGEDPVDGNNENNLTNNTTVDMGTTPTSTDMNNVTPDDMGDTTGDDMGDTTGDMGDTTGDMGDTTGDMGDTTGDDMGMMDMGGPDMAADLCGNGMLDPGEECDPLIPRGNPGACPRDCDDDQACTTDALLGDPALCTAICENLEVKMCMAGDGCCPTGCDSSSDGDCLSDECGNGMLDASETCDPMIPQGQMGACPASCDDGVACTIDTKTGDRSTCDLVCDNSQMVSMCTDDDGCCPSGCDSASDNDCSDPMLCGNGTVDSGETCDKAIASGMPGACTTMAECTASDSCTTATFSGTVDECSASCTRRPIQTCTDGDGCCAPGCTNANDNDCRMQNQCGNGTLDIGEECDPMIPAGQMGACPETNADCDDGRACTTDTVSGDADDCTATCDYTPVLVCDGSGGDGCCPAGCDSTNDDDCMMSNLCGNGTLDMGEECDPGLPAGDPDACPTSDADCDDGRACTTDSVSGSGCSAVCVNSDITSCVDNDGCCAPGCDSTNDSDCAPTKLPVGAACTAASECEVVGTQNQALCAENVNYTNGYCSSTCVGDADCAGSAICQRSDPSDPTGLCFAACSADTECRQADDYGCFDLLETGDTVCGPEVLDPAFGGETGAACTDSLECQASTLADKACLTEDVGHYPGGYCTARCTGNTDCPGDAICRDGGCVETCTANADCRADYRCFDYYGSGQLVCAPADADPNNPNLTGPPTRPGATCAADDECFGTITGGGGCLTDGEGWGGGYCIAGCTSDDSCPDGSFCGGESSTRNGLCFDECTASSDCRQGDGYECYDRDRHGQDYCAPVADGAGVVGDMCTSLRDCAGGQDGFCLSEPNWSDGHCVIRDCPMNGCGTGAHCITISNDPNAAIQNMCVTDCQDDTQCRPGYDCLDVDADTNNECWPSADNATASVGDACTALRDCSGGTDGFCITEQDDGDWSAGYCIIEDCDLTNPTSSCPTDSTCINAGTSMNPDPICLDDCQNDMDCRAGYFCGPTSGVCLPE